MTSLLITLAIFVGGLLLGFSLDNIRTSQILGGLEGNELDTESFLVEQAFWEEFAGDDCNFAEPRLNSISKQLTELGQYLEEYEEKSLFEKDEFEYLARRYFLLEIKAYTLEIELREECGLDNTVILFFYGNDDPDSVNQGLILDRIVEKSDSSIDVYSVNKDFEGDEAVDSIKLFYEITDTPTMIINGETRVEGYVNFPSLAETIGLDI